MVPLVVSCLGDLTGLSSIFLQKVFLAATLKCYCYSDALYQYFNSFCEQNAGMNQDFFDAHPSMESYCTQNVSTVNLPQKKLPYR